MSNYCIENLDLCQKNDDSYYTTNYKYLILNRILSSGKGHTWEEKKEKNGF